MDYYSKLSTEKLAEEKKKAESHCLNLQCKKVQLLILIERLTNLSGQRLNIFSRNKDFEGASDKSISYELKSAEASRDIVDIEIRNAKYQLKVISKILGNSISNS